ncbi:hypothetical protein EX30DRAFT_396874 [Ascodesmis nigricans]|uniref:Uncharacterized protein n=1 Tax=Ascodesmis nigricans TaxID=341454 RepID=A0A4S2MTK0_9PEZI|nr:hypothetical protein EX30DRAFT_396874 [Ascodesmis nigricans]
MMKGISKLTMMTVLVLSLLSAITPAAAAPTPPSSDPPNIPVVTAKSTTSPTSTTINTIRTAAINPNLSGRFPIYESQFDESLPAPPDSNAEYTPYLTAAPTSTTTTSTKPDSTVAHSSGTLAVQRAPTGTADTGTRPLTPPARPKAPMEQRMSGVNPKARKTLDRAMGDAGETGVRSKDGNSKLNTVGQKQQTAEATRTADEWVTTSIDAYYSRYVEGQKGGPRS